MDTNKPVKVMKEPTDLLKGEFGFATFPFMRRFFREFDTLFNRMGLPEPKFFGFEKEPTLWSPDVEVLEKGNEFIVRVDVPGLKKEEVKVEVTDEAIILQGERKQEKEEKGEGFFRSERSYGSFYRTIPLPEGVKPEEAKATVADGVLEVKMPLLKIEEKRRRLEITEPTAGTTTKAA